MEMLLLAITVVSLIVAFVMSAAAWRLSRDERARSAARVAALAAAAASRARASGCRSHATTGITAANEIGAERRRVSRRCARGSCDRCRRPSRVLGPARVSTFAARRRRPVVTASRPRPSTVDELPRRAGADVGDAFLGSAVAAGRAAAGSAAWRSPRCCCSSAVVGGGYWTVFGEPRGGVGRSGQRPRQSPLELVSLRHERRGARLAVTGLVRNPGGRRARSSS